MSQLPVQAAEVASFESRLGVKLPAYYKSTLLDDKIRRILSSKTIGSLRPGDSMSLFAGLTEELRQLHPEFPHSGVVFSCPTDHTTGNFDLTRGYLRFFLPDKDDPSRLGDTVYSWDLRKRRKSRDCTIQEWIDSYEACADDALLRELGVDKPNVFEHEGLVAEPRDPGLAAILTLRGDSALRTLASVGEIWMPCATFRVKGAYISVCDLGQTPRPAEGVRLAPGEYEVSATIRRSALGDWPVLGKIRVAPKCLRISPDLHRVFDVNVNWGAIAVYDRQTFFRKVSSDSRDSFAMDLVDAASERPCVIDTGKGTKVLVAASGDGDGSYPVYALMHGAEAVGLEVHFNANEARTQ